MSQQLSVNKILDKRLVADIDPSSATDADAAAVAVDAEEYLIETQIGGQTTPTTTTTTTMLSSTSKLWISADQLQHHRQMIDEFNQQTNNNNNNNSQLVTTTTDIQVVNGNGVAVDDDDDIQQDMEVNNDSNNNNDDDDDDVIDDHILSQKTSTSMSEPKNGFDRGYRPYKILGAKEDNGLKFLVMFREDLTKADLIPNYILHEKCPQLLIKYYEKNTLWKRY